MASTRNINTRGNYALELNQYMHSRDYTLYENSQYGTAYCTKLPGDGVNPAQMPANQLSRNAIDIETFLFGIGSTNLTEAQEKILRPELNCLPSQNFFPKKPTIMPEPLVVEKFQRPFRY